MGSKYLLPLLLLAACSAPNADPQESVAAAPSGDHGDGSLPKGATGEQLRFQIPAGWIEEEPKSDMRKIQCRLPGDDGQDASLIVYYFGPSAGSVEANITRWVSQFEQPDGSASEAHLTRSQREVAGLLVHDVQLAGTYVAETAPGSGVRVSQANWSMHSAIIESDHGHYYAKLVGPAPTVERWASSYGEFIESIQP